MGDGRTATRFLALRRNTALLLAALVLAGTGEHLWLGFGPKYLEPLGAGVFVIGLFDGLQTLLGAVYAYPPTTGAKGGRCSCSVPFRRPGTFSCSFGTTGWPWLWACSFFWPGAPFHCPRRSR
jgi:hypothetical protein